MNIQTRIREERKRLGLSQAEFGKFGPVGRTTVINWERGEGSPDTNFLANAALAGVDVLYVITGARSTEVSSGAKQTLLDLDVKSLGEVIRVLDECLEEKNLHLPTDKKAELISLVYSLYISMGENTEVRPQVERVLKLVA